jgi:hypothetical protein
VRMRPEGSFVSFLECKDVKLIGRRACHVVPLFIPSGRAP